MLTLFFRNINKIWEKILNLVYPFFCIGCGEVEGEVCGKCFADLKVEKLWVCGGCEAVMEFELGCKCGVGEVLEGVMVLGRYDGQNLLMKMVTELKYNGVKVIPGLVVDRMRSLVIEMIEGKFCGKKWMMTPLPLSKIKQKSRGFNQVSLIFSKIFGEWKLANWQDGLIIKIRSTAAQMTLGEKERRRNLAGTFKVSDKLVELVKMGEVEEVLVLDDVATTLTTLREAAKVLKEAGVKRVFGLTLLKT